MVYNGKATDSLDFLRYQRFCEKVASKKSHRPYFQHQQQQNITAFAYIFKSKNGKDLQVIFILQTGDGKTVMRGSHHFYLLILNI